MLVQFVTVREKKKEKIFTCYLSRVVYILSNYMHIYSRILLEQQKVYIRTRV